MRDVLLIVVVLAFMLLGFPAMKRLDRFLNEEFKSEWEAPAHQKHPTGK